MYSITATLVSIANSGRRFLPSNSAVAAVLLACQYDGVTYINEEVLQAQLVAMTWPLKFTCLAGSDNTFNAQDWPNGCNEVLVVLMALVRLTLADEHTHEQEWQPAQWHSAVVSSSSCKLTLVVGCEDYVSVLLTATHQPSVHASSADRFHCPCAPSQQPKLEPAAEGCFQACNSHEYSCRSAPIAAERHVLGKSAWLLCTLLMGDHNLQNMDLDMTAVFPTLLEIVLKAVAASKTNLSLNPLCLEMLQRLNTDVRLFGDKASRILPPNSIFYMWQLFSK